MLLPATLFFQVSWILLYELIWIFFFIIYAQCTYHDDDDDFTILWWYVSFSLQVALKEGKTALKWWCSLLYDLQHFHSFRGQK